MKRNSKIIIKSAKFGEGNLAMPDVNADGFPARLFLKELRSLAELSTIPSFPELIPMPKLLRILMWLFIALTGALAVATIALHRGEQINAMWLVVAAFCTYAFGYRFYSKFISAKVLALDAQRATPAERLENGRDFVPTNKWVRLRTPLCRHRWPGAAGGPGAGSAIRISSRHALDSSPAQCFGGCVQDFVILLFSVRRDGKSLTEMAREEIGRVGGLVAYVAVISIIVILLGVGAPDRGQCLERRVPGARSLLR